MKIAAVQFAPEFKKVQKNIDGVVRLVSQAAKAGADLVVLPELCTTGYSFMGKEDAAPFGEFLSLPPGAVLPLVWRPDSLRTMRELCQSLNVAVAWGVLEKEYGTGKLYNSQVLMLPNGEFVSYRKLNRWANDFLWAEAGNANPPIVSFKGHKVGLLICRDIRDKSSKVDDFYEPGDADIVLLSSNFGDGGFPATSWMKFVEDNKTWLVVSNRYGREANNDFGEGGICVISPEGKVSCSGLIWNQTCIVYTEVP